MTPAKTGCVVIGRNEGERLIPCLRSATGLRERTVYVDSGSTDGSVAAARALGFEVLCLDPATPFTAARARNEGLALLRRSHPDLEYVQFVDGDCELAPHWFNIGAAFLDAHRDVAIVCGRLRERNTGASIYNLLCDIEWDRPVGVTTSCGGICMARAAAFEAVHGFRLELICGEEPELCVRLRAAGWRVWRLA